MHKETPKYLITYKKGEFTSRNKKLWQLLEQCSLCPWSCGVNRLENDCGQCGIGKKARVSSFMTHYGEEKPISGQYGSGTIFFSGCNLNCQFCQNWEISQKLIGHEVNDQDLAEMMLTLQHQGCHNINLVSPTHVVPQIISALMLAIPAGLSIPIVYNSGGYDAIHTLRLLDGIIDIYMPDMKYADDIIAEKYSGIKSYSSINRAAVREMHLQVGDLKINAQGIAFQGLLVRHLVLPNELAGTKNIAEFLAREISTETYINIMNQYRPEFQAPKHPKINRRISIEENQKAIAEARLVGLHRFD